MFLPGARLSHVVFLFAISACSSSGSAPGNAVDAGLSGEPTPVAATPRPSSTVAESTQNEAAVRDAFEAYRAAALARDGKRARALLDRKTVETYQEYLTLARTVDRAGLKRLDWMGKFMVLRLRHEFDRKTLDAMTGDSLLVLSIERGWISDASVREAKIGEVRLDGARANMSLAQQPKTPIFFFVQEPDGWKFSLWKTFPLGEFVLQKAFEESGAKDEIVWVVSLIEALSPKRFDNALIDGPPK
jgi:hypothetical protein